MKKNSSVPKRDSPLWAEISSLLSPERYNKILEQSALRTNRVAVVMEDLHFTQNMSAVVRTADCMGVQDVYLIGEATSCRINHNVAKGASHWVDVHRRAREPRKDVLNELKQKGYKIVATLPDKNAVSLPEYDVSKGKTALVFGNESRGISDEVREVADEFLTIPMFGFTESYNISVSVGLCLYQITQKLRNETSNWQLTEEELRVLRYRWMKQGMKRADKIEDEFVVRLEHPNDQ